MQHSRLGARGAAELLIMIPERAGERAVGGRRAAPQALQSCPLPLCLQGLCMGRPGKGNHHAADMGIKGAQLWQADSSAVASAHRRARPC